MDKTATRLQAITKDGRAFRMASVGKINTENRTVELAFSSEAEVERWWGVEVLSHDPGAVVMTRLQDGAPLLVNHDTDCQVGVIESVSIDADRRGRAVVRFGRSERAEEIFADVQDGIRKHVSVGYLIHDAKLTETRDDDEVWTITKWEPFEISIVPVPADITVGVGRSLEGQHIQPFEKGTREMTDKTIAAPAAPAPAVDVQAERSKGSETERARVRAIGEMGEKYHGARDLALAAIKDGKSVEEFQRELLDHTNKQANRALGEQTRDADIGLTEAEIGKFRFLNVIRAMVDPTDRAAQKAAGFEFEASRAAAEKLGVDTDKFVVPVDVLTRALTPQKGERVMNTSTSGAAAGDTGGYGIATTLLTQSFIDILRNRATIMQLGTVLGGLVGNIDIPKQTAAATGYWLGEDDDSTETGIELGQISMSPKTVAAFSEITRKLMVQSSLDVEAMLRFDLAKQLALTIDKAGYYGSGSKQQPLGICNHTGINAVSFAATQPTYAELVQMETEIALDNADVPGMAYVGNAQFRGSMKTSLKFPGAAVAQGGPIWEPGNSVNGYRTEITNQLTTGDVVFGNFSDLLIGMWSGLQLLVDPYSNSKKGRIRITAFQDVDFALRRVESFCVGRH
jgi:HK97 family phage major capsid protein/HK97 family phage prohead protease